MFVTVLVTVLVIGGLVKVLITVAVGPETVRVEVVVRVLVTLRPGVVTVPNTVAPGSVVTVPFLVTTLPFSTSCG